MNNLNNLKQLLNKSKRNMIVFDPNYDMPKDPNTGFPYHKIIMDDIFAMHFNKDENRLTSDPSTYTSYSRFPKYKETPQFKKEMEEISGYVMDEMHKQANDYNKEFDKTAEKVNKEIKEHEEKTGKRVSAKNRKFRLGMARENLMESDNERTFFDEIKPGNRWLDDVLSVNNENNNSIARHSFTKHILRGIRKNGKPVSLGSGIRKKDLKEEKDREFAVSPYSVYTGGSSPKIYFFDSTEGRSYSGLAHYPEIATRILPKGISDEDNKLTDDHSISSEFSPYTEKIDVSSVVHELGHMHGLSERDLFHLRDEDFVEILETAKKLYKDKKIKAVVRRPPHIMRDDPEFGTLSNKIISSFENAISEPRKTLEEFKSLSKKTKKKMKQKGSVYQEFGRTYANWLDKLSGSLPKNPFGRARKTK